MSNAGGKFGRSIVSPETFLIDHESRIKILERGTTSVSVVIEGGGVLIWGIGPPVDSIGSDNDFYIDIDAKKLYGPKIATAWPDEFFGLGGAAATKNLMGYAEWDYEALEWTYDGEGITARPEFEGKLIWIGGDASTDDPASMMEIGDIWYPGSE